MSAEPARERRTTRRPLRLLLAVVGVGLVAFLLGYGITALVLGGSRAEIATVPDLRGRSEADARRILRRSDLELERGTSLVHPEVARGAVLAQTPLPGQEVAPGTAVRVMLSAGRERKPIPDVQTLTGTQAQALLGRAGFRVRVEQVHSQRARGRVVEVRPAVGTLVELPAEVQLVLSAGPPPVAVPDLHGLTDGAAAAALDAAGLDVGRIDYDPLAVEPIGEVVAQQPAAGQEVPPGSRVNITVSGLPPRIETGTGVF